MGLEFTLSQSRLCFYPPHAIIWKSFRVEVGLAGVSHFFRRLVNKVIFVSL